MKALIGVETLRKLPKGRPVDIRDTKLRGFVLRVRPSGINTYFANYARGKWKLLGTTQVLTPPEAREAAREVLGGAMAGEDPIAEAKATAAAEAKRITFETFCREHYTPWATAQRKTGVEQAARLAAVFGPLLNDLRLDEITAFHVERWRSGRLKDGKAAATVNRDLNVLRGALSRALDWHLLDVHPLAKVKASKTDRSGVVRYLEADEERRLLAALSARDDQRRSERERANVWRKARGYRRWPAYGTYTDHLTPIVTLAVHTGLRRGEIFGLQWRDVDLVAIQTHCSRRRIEVWTDQTCAAEYDRRDNVGDLARDHEAQDNTGDRLRRRRWRTARGHQEGLGGTLDAREDSRLSIPRLPASLREQASDGGRRPEHGARAARSQRLQDDIAVCPPGAGAQSRGRGETRAGVVMGRHTTVQLGAKGLTIVSAGYRDEEHNQTVAAAVSLELLAAEVAFREGNPEGLITALEIYRDHRAGQPLPAWITDGTIRQMREGSPPPSSRGGRHAREGTKRRDLAADWVRALLVETLLERGISKRAAYRAVSEQLTGDASGSVKVIEQAYRRVCARLAINPADYYPLVGGLDFLLQVLRKQT